MTNKSAGRPKMVVKFITQLAKEEGVTSATIRNRLKANKYGEWQWADDAHKAVRLQEDYKEFFAYKRYEKVKVIRKERDDSSQEIRNYDKYFYVNKYATWDEARKAAEKQAIREADNDADWLQGVEDEEFDAVLEEQIKLYTMQNLDAKKEVPKEGPQKGSVGVASRILPHIQDVANRLSLDVEDRTYFIDTCFEYMQLLSSDKAVPNKFKRNRVVDLVLNEISLNRKLLKLYMIRDSHDEDLQDDIDKITNRIDKIASGLGWVHRKGMLIDDPGEEKSQRAQTPDNTDGSPGDMY